MKRRNSWLTLLIIPLVVGSVAFAGTGPTSPDPRGEVQSVTYGLEENAPPKSPEPSGEAVRTDLAMHGTLWTAELRGQFQIFQPKGWGTTTRVKAASLQWVHIPLPYATFINGVAQRIQYVEFCAQSSNGAISKPVRMDLWANNQRFLSKNIGWLANNAIQCRNHAFATPVWKEDLGLSVLLNFANATDQITLYKAWVRLVP